MRLDETNTEAPTPCLSGADPGFLPGEGAKGLMTVYMEWRWAIFWHTQTQICNFSRCLLPYYAWMLLNNHSRDTSFPYFCPWDDGTRAEGAGPSVPGVGAGPSAPPPLDPRLSLVHLYQKLLVKKLTATRWRHNVTSDDFSTGNDATARRGYHA